MPTKFDTKTGKFVEVDDEDKKHVVNFDAATVLIKGDKGDKGDTGERGEKGDVGEKGKDGVDGKSIIGPVGPAGKDGLGISGKDGIDGDDGLDGRGIASITQTSPDVALITYTDGLTQSINLPKGKDGREIELGRNQTHIQWRYKGDKQWNDLFVIPKSRSGGGGAHHIKDLNDVLLAGLTNGQTLIWDEATGYWKNGAGGSGSVAIGGAVTGGTQPAVLYIGAGGVLAQDPLIFGYNETAGRLVVGDTTETIQFFTNDETKFLVNGNITSVDNFVSIGSTTAFLLNPVADTNTGDGGFAVYAAQGFNLVLQGNNDFNGGLPIFGVPENSSGVGAFGQVTVDSTGTVDGVYGLACTASHGGVGAAVSLLIGGVFSASTGDDLASGSTTGTLDTAIGGYFVTLVDSLGISITNAFSGKFVEPYIRDAGDPGTITNRTALLLEGTQSTVLTVVSTSGNIDALAVTTGFIELSGNPTLRGVDEGFDGKEVDIYFSAGGIIRNMDANPNAANRIKTMDGADKTFTGDGFATLKYHSGQSVWLLKYSSL